MFVDCQNMVTGFFLPYDLRQLITWLNVYKVKSWVKVSNKILEHWPPIIIMIYMRNDPLILLSSWLWTERQHSERTGSYIDAKYTKNNLCKVCTKSADCAAQVSHSNTYLIHVQTYPLAKSPGLRGKWHTTRRQKTSFVDSTCWLFWG